MPAPPRLVYDDDCGFCTWAAYYLVDHGEFELVAFSDLSPDQRARLPADWESCAHLLTDDAVYSCGAAMTEAFARTSLPGAGAERALRRLPGYATAREGVYRAIADNRSFFGRFLHR
jgi:predicted DCC family thiol-disulfide oxidoreductase YuxK